MSSNATSANPDSPFILGPIPALDGMTVNLDLVESSTAEAALQLILASDIINDTSFPALNVLVSPAGYGTIIAILAQIIQEGKMACKDVKITASPASEDFAPLISQGLWHMFVRDSWKAAQVEVKDCSVHVGPKWSLRI